MQTQGTERDCNSLQSAQSKTTHNSRPAGQRAIGLSKQAKHDSLASIPSGSIRPNQEATPTEADLRRLSQRQS